MKLVVIGNGMDIDHSANTRWKNIFTEEKMSRLEELSEKMGFLTLYSKTLSKDSLDKYGELWSDFEKGIKNMVDAHVGTFTQYLQWAGEPELKEIVIEHREKIINKFIRWQESGNYPSALIETTFEILNILRDRIFEVNNQMTSKVSNIKNDPTLLSVKNWYRQFFDFNRIKVINYNYTTFYEGLYYENAFHIHGKIGDDYLPHQVDDGRVKGDIELGNYTQTVNASDEINANLKSQLLSKLKTDDKTLDTLIDCFRDQMGDKNLFFGKGTFIWPQNEESIGETLLKLRQDYHGVDTLSFIGHSLSENDLDFLLMLDNSKGFVDLKRIQKIEIVNYWEIGAFPGFKKSVEEKLGKYIDVKSVEFSYFNTKTRRQEF